MRSPAYLSLCKNLLRIIGLAMLIISVQGCSTVRLAYNQAPLAAYWYLDDYVDFSDEQKPAVKAALNELHHWHRQTQLPAYIETLQKMQRQMPESLTPAKACDFYQEVQERLMMSLEGAVRFDQTPAASFNLQKLATLDRNQLLNMERKFAKSNVKYREDYLSGSPRQVAEKRLEQAVSRTESLYGKLDERQQALLQTRLEQTGFDPEMAYAERLRRQQDMLQALRSLASGAVLASGAAGTAAMTPAAAKTVAAGPALEGVFSRAVFSPDISFREHARKIRTQNCQTFAEVHNSTTPAQRQKALARLQGYEQDLRALLRHQ
ncbi:MAG: hypothetical protein RLZZ03_1456 [Pseudomonadota bacterium]